MLAFTLLGSIVITRDGEFIDRFRSQTEIALLAYLAHTSQAHGREAIADLLWEARSTAQSLSNLRTVLSRLRKQIGDELVVTRKTVTLRAGALEQVDSVRLQRELQAIGIPQSPMAAVQLKAVLDLYAGEFMVGFYLPDAPRFNEWVVVEQERLRQLVVTGLQRLTAFSLANNDPVAGIGAARRWLAIDELSETASTQLIRFLALNGQTHAALTQYDKLVELLDEELGVEPGRDSAELAALIRRGGIDPLSPKDEQVPVEIPHNLPRELTPFIGRSADRAALVERLLNPAYPFITVTGEGGIGKTRLALAAARTITADSPPAFPDGVWFVPLAGMEDGASREAVAGAISVSMNLSLHGERRPSEQLAALLQPKSCLIVLDNFEQLLEKDAPDLVNDLLEAGEGIHILVTSRARLGYSSEFVVHLAGLPVPHDEAQLPGPGDHAQLRQAVTYDSVQLFVERARRTGTPFQLDDCAEEVTAICRYVAGVPLAIELAAAWVGRMSCAAIAAAIASNLHFLSTQQRDVPQRQRSMQAVFDYSWNVLDSEAQQAMAQASVFRGGFGDEAALAILGSRAGQLERLVEHSLIERTVDGRYAMHDLVREFAAEKLHQDDSQSSGGAAAETERLRRRHGDYFLNLAGNVTLVGERSGASIATAQIDLDNIRKAWRWAVAGPHVTEMATAWQGLWIFYDRRSLFLEGEEAFRSALAALIDGNPTTAETSSMAAQLRVAQAALLNVLNRYDEAIALAEAILAYAEARHDIMLLAWGRLIWGTALYRQGHFPEALGQLKTGLIVAEQGGLGRLEADIRRRLGTTLLEQGDIPRARMELERALQIYRQVSMRTSEGNVLGDLGWLEQRARNLVVAREHLSAALTIQRDLENYHDTTILLINLAGVCGAERRFDQAISFLMEALANLDLIDDRYHRSLVNHGLGIELSRVGDHDRARTYYERSLLIDWEVGDVAGIAWTQNNLGLLHNKLGEYKTALALHQEALRSAQTLGIQTTEGLSQSRIGQDLYGLGRYEESLEALRSAVAIQHELDQAVWEAESNASMAITYLALDQRQKALDLAEALLPLLNAINLQGAREPFRACWNCYQVLDTLGDPRAAGLLAAIRRDLLDQAAAIQDARLRQSFLNNIPSHRLLIATGV